MTNDRPPIPEEIKREVRKRCGYGCVICGTQLYDYDHIVEYNKVLCHEADNLTLLCKQHHGEKTARILPVADIVKATDLPYNLRSDTVKPRFLHFSGKRVVVKLGGSSFAYEDLKDGYTFTPLQIGGVPLISFRTEEQKLLLSFVAFDRNDEPIVEIVDNEIAHRTKVWDAHWAANKLSIRDANKSIFLQAAFDTPDTIRFTRGHFRYKGVELSLDGESLFFWNAQSVFSRLNTLNCAIGICIEGYAPFTGDRKAAKKKMKELSNGRRRW